MNDTPLQVAATLIGIVLAVAAIAWAAAGRERRRRWAREMREIGIARTIARFVSLTGVVFGTASLVDTDLSYTAELASMVGLEACLIGGLYLGVRAARERYPEDYEAMRVGRAPADPAIRRDVYRVMAKWALWSLVPGLLWAGAIHLVWG